MAIEDAATIIFAVVVLSCGLIWPFLLCHHGTFATERIRSIDSIVYNANWRNYPPELQKYFILIIAQSQSNINFNGFNLLSCSLEAFAKVLIVHDFDLYSMSDLDSNCFISNVICTDLPVVWIVLCHL